jgi:uncharacterized protein YmfQ (DUF2313 family)
MASRKHYVSLAKELGYAMAIDDEQAVRRCASIIAEVLGQENPRFNRERFMDAVDESFSEWAARVEGVMA